MAHDVQKPRIKIIADEHHGETCWSCGVPALRSHAICGACGKMHIAAEGKSYFALLGLPEQFAVDLNVLEESFYKMSRLLHPDRFAGAGALERRLAVQRTTLLNDAYRSLKESLKRAEYLLQREGVHRGEETGTKDPELLMEILEAREEVEGLRARVRGHVPGALEQLARLRLDIEKKLATLFAEIDAFFRRYDAGEHDIVKSLGGTVERIRYFSGIKTELDQTALAAQQMA